MLRNVLFWTHLGAGLVAGLLILLLSVTGVLLTYETQITDAARARAVSAPAGAVPLDADALIAALAQDPANRSKTLGLSSSPTAPVTLAEGRARQILDPYTAAPLPGAGAGAERVFATVTALHRWLSLSGRNETGAALAGAANLLFLFLVCSGLYLWLPPVFRWGRVKLNLFLRRGLPNAQARHYNWHHVFGIWALVPLFVIVLSGVVISYPWASSLVYAAVGEEAPQRRGPPAGGPPPLADGLQGKALDGTPMSYSALLGVAAEGVPGWNTLTLAMPQAGDAYLRVTMDRGNGVQRGAQTHLVLDRVSGDIVSATPGDAGMSTGARLRTWFRFVHTGQIYGVVGQTVAGLASLASVLLVYTGLSLGIRRLARMWRRRRAA